MKITVFYHSADFDGIFCREIARKFLPDAELIGWDFGDKPLPIPDGQIYILDLPVDRVFGFNFDDVKTIIGLPEFRERLIWIDHHKSSIESHPQDIPGYRIDGVAACRLAWQWFIGCDKMVQRRAVGLPPLPTKEQFIDRLVHEPYAVRLAGEYDVWDKRDPNAETLQFGLRSREMTPFSWHLLLSQSIVTLEQLTESQIECAALLKDGKLMQGYQQQNDESLVNHRSFLMEFDGLKFLTLNTARCNSLTFAAKDVPETGHDALCGYFWNGSTFRVSLYHAKHRTDIDLSEIAKKHGGGGHRGACGFESKTFPI